MMKQENKMSKTKLVPFDIEKAKNGAKVITRCGYPVTIIGCNSNKKYPIRAIIQTEDGPFTFSFTVEGKYCVDEEEHELDFFIEEEDVEAEEEEEVEETDYDPYKATVESIADMVERYAELQSLEELKDFYNNVKIKCRDAFEFLEEKTADNNPKIEKVKTRRMTNQELSWWLREHPEEHREYMYKSKADEPNVHIIYPYCVIEADEEVDADIYIRRNCGEWEKPLIEI